MDKRIVIATLFLVIPVKSAEAAAAAGAAPQTPVQMGRSNEIISEEETISQVLKRKAWVLTYGEAPVFCGEIQDRYYDRTHVKPGSLARRGERALEDACSKRLIDSLFTIIEFFKTRKEQMNPVQLAEASRVLLPLHTRTLDALAFASASDGATLAKIAAAKQALQ